MLDEVKTSGKPLASFRKGDTIQVNNKMRKGYSYVLEEEPGTNFAAQFQTCLGSG